MPTYTNSYGTTATLWYPNQTATAYSGACQICEVTAATTSFVVQQVICTANLWTQQAVGVLRRMEYLADEVFQARDRREAVQARGEIQGARERAEKLLRGALDPAQLLELAERGYFTVLGQPQPDGSRRRYRVNRGRHGNIQEVSEGGIILARLCVHPRMEVPDADTMLAQKLWLESGEEQIRRVANRTVLR